MSDQTLFNEQTPPAAPATDNQQPATTTGGYDTLLQGITTDDGRQKYATLSDAINSIPHKEQHITTLESENSVLREQIAEWKAKAEAAEALKLQQDNTPTGNPQTEQPSASIDVNEIAQRVHQELSAKEKQAQAKAKLMTFKQKLVETYGEKAQEVYTAKLTQEGLSEQVFLGTVVANPEFAWKSLGLDTKPVETSPIPDSTYNSTATNETRPDTSFAFRPKGQAKPGSKYASQKEATMKRLKEQGLI